MALQKATAAAPGSTIYRRSGTTWTLDQTLIPADYATGTGDAHAVLYRDNVLITIEGLPSSGYGRRRISTCQMPPASSRMSA